MRIDALSTAPDGVIHPIRFSGSCQIEVLLIVQRTHRCGISCRQQGCHILLNKQRLSELLDANGVFLSCTHDVMGGVENPFDESHIHRSSEIASHVGLKRVTALLAEELGLNHGKELLGDAGQDIGLERLARFVEMSDGKGGLKGTKSRHGRIESVGFERLNHGEDVFKHCFDNVMMDVHIAQDIIVLK